MALSQARRGNLRKESFGVEGPLPNAIPMPAAGIRAIERAPDPEESVQLCLQQERRSRNDIPASWFSAGQVNLTGTPDSGLVVRGDRGCFLGAHITQFCALAKTVKGYRSVFTARADGLNVLGTATNGYRDLQLVFVAAAGKEIETVTFQYRKGAYRVVRRHIDRQKYNLIQSPPLFNHVRRT